MYRGYFRDKDNKPVMLIQGRNGLAGFSTPGESIVIFKDVEYIVTKEAIKELESHGLSFYGEVN